MQLFIDANIYLAFYHLTSDDLEELNKLAVLVEQKKVTLYVTDQVQQEFGRNRERIIADALKRLREQHLNLQFPQICMDYREYGKLREQQKAYEKEHAALIDKLKSDIADNSLKADKTIAKLFGNATILETTASLVERARLRMQVGNPPGKDGSLGDAINWELLLEKLPAGDNLFFITDDKDYISTLDENALKEYLADEWESTNHSEVLFHRRLSLFFKEKFPQIKLATELEKDLLIQGLVASPNFATTHELIAKLSNTLDYSADQVNSIVAAALWNDQVRWIINDEDVETFYAALAETHSAVIEPGNYQELLELLYQHEPHSEQDDEPF